MARIRTIKPEFWSHEGLSELPPAVHMLAAALLNYADDEGYFNANPGLVKAGCCPLRHELTNTTGDLPETSGSVTEALHMLSKSGYIRLGTADDGRTYGHIINFLSHQTINKPSKSKIADKPIRWHGVPETSRNTTVAIPEDSHWEQGTGNREQGNKEDGESANARDASPGTLTFRERILIAMGRDKSGLDANGRQAGSRIEMVEAERWITDLNLTEDDVLSVVTEITAKMTKRGDPPSSFRFFTTEMQRLAAAKAEGALQPATVAARATPTITVDPQPIRRPRAQIPEEFKD